MQVALVAQLAVAVEALVAVVAVVVVSAAVGVLAVAVEALAVEAEDPSIWAPLSLSSSLDISCMLVRVKWSADAQTKKCLTLMPPCI